MISYGSELISVVQDLNDMAVELVRIREILSEMAERLKDVYNVPELKE